MMIPLAVLISICLFVLVVMVLAVMYWTREPGEHLLPDVRMELHRIRLRFELAALRRQSRADGERLRRELRDETDAIRRRRLEER